MFANGRFRPKADTRRVDFRLVYPGDVMSRFKRRRFLITARNTPGLTIPQAVLLRAHEVTE